MPKGTAWDLIQYESEELGNDIGILLTKEELKKINALNCRWLTESKKSAMEYGEALSVRIGDHRIIAKDNYGGLLIETL